MYVNAVQEVLARSEESVWLDIIDKEQAVIMAGGIINWGLIG